MEKESQKGFIAMALDMAGFIKDDIELALRSYDFITSKVTTMDHMFTYVGYSSTTFTLNLGNKFNTSNVKNFSYMFKNVGYANPNLELDLSSFDFSSATRSEKMFKNMRSTNKIWVKDSTDQAWVIARNSNFSTSNVLIK